MAKKTDIRKQLLDAGVYLLSTKPPDQISMDDVAAKAAVTKPMIYYYFGSRTGFYENLVHYVLEAVNEILDNCLVPAASFREILYKTILQRITLTTQNPELAKTIKIMMSRERIAGVETRKRIFQIFSRIVPAFEKAVRQGEIDENVNMELIMAMIHSLIDAAIQVHGRDFFHEIDPSDCAETLIKIVFDGIGKRESL